MKEDNIDIAAVPSFTEVTIEGVERTAVHMAIYRQADLIAPDQLKKAQENKAADLKDRVADPITISV